jgi:hypothetical protein
MDQVVAVDHQLQLGRDLVNLLLINRYMVLEDQVVEIMVQHQRELDQQQDQLVHSCMAQALEETPLLQILEEIQALVMYQELVVF